MAKRASRKIVIEAERLLAELPKSFGFDPDDTKTFIDSIRSMAKALGADFHKYVKFFYNVLIRIKDGLKLTKDDILSGDAFAIAKAGGLI